jgi:hypothetical protein
MDKHRNVTTNKYRYVFTEGKVIDIAAATADEADGIISSIFPRKRVARKYYAPESWYEKAFDWLLRMDMKFNLNLVGSLGPLGRGDDFETVSDNSNSVRGTVDYRMQEQIRRRGN